MEGRKKLEHRLPWIVRDHLAQKLFSQMGRQAKGQRSDTESPGGGQS